MTSRKGPSRRPGAGEDGATMLEYALMLAFVAILCVAAVAALGQSLAPSFQQAINGLS